MRPRYYVGHHTGQPTVFASATAPTEQTHGHIYRCVTGPFRTRQAAALMAEQGSYNPHLRSVADAERTARTPARTT